MSAQTSILLVDDNPGLRQTLSFILARKGYAVAVAESGLEAVARVRAQSFDVIFVDIKMPILNGAETCKLIKELRPEAVVVMMSAYAVEDLVQQALAEGAYGIIHKPFDIDRVIALIEETRQVKSGALILIVDDDPGTCVTFKNILVRKGYTVGVAHTGEQGVALAQEKAYDIIFIDMKLPTLDGLQTYLAIRKFDPQSVAVVITGYPQEMNGLVEAALQHSAFVCLYKPLDMAAVLKLIAEIEQKKQAVGRGAEGP